MKKIKFHWKKLYIIKRMINQKIFWNSRISLFNEIIFRKNMEKIIIISNDYTQTHIIMIDYYLISIKIVFIILYTQIYYNFTF